MVKKTSKKVTTRRAAATPKVRHLSGTEIVAVSLVSLVVFGGVVWWGINKMSSATIDVNEVGVAPATTTKVVREWNFDAQSDIGPQAWRLVRPNTNGGVDSLGGKVVDGTFSLLSTSKQLGDKNLALWNRYFDYALSDVGRTNVKRLRVELTMAENYVITSAGGQVSQNNGDNNDDGSNPQPITFDNKVVMELQTSATSWKSPVLIRKEEVARVKSGTSAMTSYVFEVAGTEITQPVKAIRFYINTSGKMLASVKVDKIAISHEFVTQASTPAKSPTVSNIVVQGMVSRRQLEGRNACYLTANDGVVYMLASTTQNREDGPNAKGSDVLGVTTGGSMTTPKTMPASRDVPDSCAAFASYIGSKVEVSGMIVEKNTAQTGIPQGNEPVLRVVTIKKI